MTLITMTDTPKFRDACALLRGSSGAAWLQELRQSAFARFQAGGFPTRKSEDWKYINLESVLETPFVPRHQLTSQPHVEESAIAASFLTDAQARWTSINGRFSAELSSIADLPSGTIIADLRSTLTDHDSLLQPLLTNSLEGELNPFVFLNTVLMEEGLFVSIPEETVWTKPLQLLLIHAESAALPTVAHPRIVINVGARAKIDILITEIGLSETRYFNNAVLNVNVGEGALLNLATHSRLPRTAIHFTASRLVQDAGSSVSWTAYHHGSALSRDEICIDLAGEAASTKLAGLGLLAFESQLYSHLVVHHRRPHVMSRQLFKNILGGSARSEFNSLAFIHHGAVQADSEQLNRNMVLSRKARAITRPQLKVFNDDVKGAHGATIGQVSPEELFYLRSRGLNSAEARATLIYGFAEEIVLSVPSPELRAHLERFVRSDLNEVVHDVA